MATSPEQGLFALLTGSHLSPAGSALTVIVGTRIYWDVLPEGVTYPAVRLQRISTNRDEFRSIDTGVADYAQSRFQIDAWALSRLAAINLSQAVFATIEAAHASFVDLRVDPCWTEDEAGDLEEGIGPNGADVYRQRLDIMMPFAIGDAL